MIEELEASTQHPAEARSTCPERSLRYTVSVLSLGLVLVAGTSLVAVGTFRELHIHETEVAFQASSSRSPELGGPPNNRSDPLRSQVGKNSTIKIQVPSSSDSIKQQSDGLMFYEGLFMVAYSLLSLSIICCSRIRLNKLVSDLNVQIDTSDHRLS